MLSTPPNKLFRSVVFGSGARIVALGSQFAVLLMLSQMLLEHQFGDMMIAFAIYRVVSFAIGTGLGNLVLLHVARSGATPGIDAPLHRTVLLIGAATSAVVAATTALFANEIAALFGKPELSSWLIYMSPMAVFGTVNLITAGSLDGRSMIPRSIAMNELNPNLLRLVGLAAVWGFRLDPFFAAFVFWAAIAISWLFEVVYLTQKHGRWFSQVTSWDLKYAANFAAQSLGSMQLQGMDLILVGLLFSSSAAGSYALASRIAVFFPFFSNIVAKNFTPVAARLIHQDQKGELQQEVLRLKKTNMLANSANIALCIVLTVIISELFVTQYSGVLQLVLLFAIPALARSFFFGVDKLLQAAGFSFESAAVQAISLVNLFVTGTLLAPAIGIYSIPVAMLVSSLVLNPASEYLVRSRLQVRTFHLNDIVPMALLSVLSIAAIVVSPTLVAAGFIAGLVLLWASIVAFGRARHITPDLDK